MDNKLLRSLKNRYLDMEEVLKNRQNEKGQAIVEMVVGLIGICTVLIAVLFTASIGNANILTLITSRENADQEFGGVAPTNIGDRNIWKIEFNDGIPEIDDAITAGTVPDNADFSGPLGSNGTIAVVGNGDFATDPLVIGAQQNDIFLNASFLEGSAGSDGPQQAVEDLGLLTDFRNFLGITDINLSGHESNQVFMPTGLR